MNLNKKIKAFTLSEIMVVLILTAIIAGLAFTVLNLVQKQMLSIRANFQTNTQLQLFEQSLWIDFNRHEKIVFNDLEDTLEFSSQLDSISYKFKKEFVIKEQDTFAIPLAIKTFYFDGAKTDKGLVDAIKLEMSQRLQGKNLFIFKRNDANVFMN